MENENCILFEPKHVGAWALREMNVSMPYVLDYEANGNIYLFDRRNAPERIAPGSELWNKIKEIEEQRHVTIYAVTHDYLPIVGEMYSYLCISPYPEDWEHMVRRSGNLLSSDNLFIAYAYVQNVANDLCSEFGYVALQVENGELRRVG